MKTIPKVATIILVLVSFFGIQPVLAQRKGGVASKDTKVYRDYDNRRSVGTDHYRDGRYRTQPIYRNPHYRYPRHHRVVRTLPRHHMRVMYLGLPYFYYAGIYYTVYNDAYTVVLPPSGFRITVLPVGYVSITVGPSIYFYHSGVYYTKTSTPSSEEVRYEVTYPPVGTLITDIHEDAEEVIIDGKIFYDFNNVLYKRVSTFDGNTAYEVVYINKEN
ncbi:DUF6515 family protein [Aquimarina sediminis]|uniref:DUF6515 family protein n=1 Tax=Aquimarina sediminis TaxID=2070536 RepID=UPI000CA07CBE|nr:DUF6515 family protein [Aquimarina sediminis]